MNDRTTYLDRRAPIEEAHRRYVAAARTEDARCAAIRAAALRVEAAMLEANCGVMESEARREIDALTAAVVVLEDLVNHGAKP